ncbi:MAG: carboxypeptidase regulatory-like domain-containing protein, partial [Opitutaceae bacterium]
MTFALFTSLTSLSRNALLAFATLAALPSLSAQSSATTSTAAPAASGSITGRVQNTDTGQYVNNARVTVRGTNLVAPTDETGTFRLSAVPAGEVILEIFF